MSNDEVRWCKNDNDDDGSEYERIHASHENDVNNSYTFLPVHRQTKQRGKDFSYDDQISVINIRNKHSNYRDSRHKFSVERHTSALRGSGRQFLRIYSRNFCLLTTFVLLHVLGNLLVSSVSCDELIDAVGARNHYTHTWAVHIPGGEDVARQVANEHGMNFRGKVSNPLTYYP
jgi:Peptidase S8 pro-domain